MLLSIREHTDRVIENTRSRPQETLEFKMNKQMQTFSLKPLVTLVQEGKWLLAVISSFECTNSVFNITNKKNSFSVTIPGHWDSKYAEKLFDEIKSLLELRSLELNVKEVRKRGNKIKTGDNEYSLLDFYTQKNEILEELKNIKYNDLEDLVYRMQVTYDEIIDILDLKYIPTKRTGCSLNPGIYEVIDLNNTSKDN